MGKIAAEFRPNTLSNGIGESYGLAPAPAKSTAETDYKRVEEQLIFDEAISLGSDWLEATDGTPLTRNQFHNLYYSGYTSYTPDRIEELFYDWQDYQEITRTYYADRLQQARDKKTELLEKIEQQKAQGLIPEQLFIETKGHSVTYCPVEQEPGEPVKVIRLQRHEFTGLRAPDDQIIQRYSRYIVASQILKTQPDEEPFPEARLLNIVQGFSTDSGKALSSFVGALKNSHLFLEEINVERVAEELEVYDYVYPSTRKQHLKELLSAAGPDQIEYYYDIPQRKVIVLGRFALEQFTESEGKGYLEFLNAHGQLVIGNSVKEVLDKSTQDGSGIRKLEEVLADKSITLGKKQHSHLRSLDWTNDDYIEYGRWLVGVLEPAGLVPTTRIIRAAGRMDLGPGEMSIAKVFGGLKPFFEILGFEKKPRVGKFSAWSFEDHVKSIQKIAVQTGRRPTYTRLVKMAKKNKNVPHPKLIDRDYGFTNVIVGAGYEPYRPKKTASVIIQSGREFYRQTGRLPVYKDFGGGQIMGDDEPMYKLFGSLENFQEHLSNSLLEDPVEILPPARRPEVFSFSLLF